MAYTYTYLITSERAYRRSDEVRNKFETTRFLKVGDVIELDGLKWLVEEVVKNEADN